MVVGSHEAVPTGRPRSRSTALADRCRDPDSRADQEENDCCTECAADTPVYHTHSAATDFTMKKNVSARGCAMVSVKCERTLLQANIVPGVVASHAEAAWSPEGTHKFSGFALATNWCGTR
jgi:hypothetical protein